ncbi:MAG TPA: hypothetical protein VFD62_03980 [Pyrinomonadaceae bacterium]|nr:hypothetical protein [Pyrinomonadaceae bacterium]
MSRFVVILSTTLVLTAAVAAQEHTPRRPTTPAPTPAPRVAAADPNDAGWVRFTSELGRFSVLMPDTPTDKTDTTPSEHGPYTTHLFIARDRGTNNVYLIGWVDYDPSFNFNKQSELAANRDNFVKGIKATLVSTRPLQIDGYQALEFVAQTAEMVYKSRVYMVGRRPYQIVIGYPKGTEDPLTTNRFFNSFKVRLN